MTDRLHSPSGWGGVPERIDWSVCHCGSNADGSLMGYCAHCSSVRCDAYPGACRSQCNCDLQGKLANDPHRNWCNAATKPAYPVESPDLPIPAEAGEAAAAFSEAYGYPADARYAAESALIAAGLVDPDDGTVPRWRRGDSIPVWTNPMHVVDTVLAAALPHLQVETRAKVAGEIAVAIERFLAEPHTEQDPCDQCDLMRQMARVARRIGKGDPS